MFGAAQPGTQQGFQQGQRPGAAQPFAQTPQGQATPAQGAADQTPVPSPAPPGGATPAGAIPPEGPDAIPPRPASKPTPETKVQAQTRRRFGLTSQTTVHGVVQKPVYTATSPDRTKRQDLLPPKLSAAPGTPAHPGTIPPVDAPVYTDIEQKRLTAHRRELREADPYAPLGLRIGNLYVSPSIEEDVGYDTNPNQAQNGKGSRVSRTEGEVKVLSDWSSNEFTADLRGAYSYYPDLKSANRPEGDGKADYRLDVTKDLNFTFEGRGNLSTQQPNSANLPFTTSSRPLVWAYGGTIGTDYHPGYWDFSLKGNIDRTVYENATLADGTELNQSNRDMTQYELRAKLGYQVTPGIKPFVEARIDTRQYDQPFDSAGFDRTSNGVSAFLGTAFEFTRTLTGEVAIGYGDRSYDDPRLKDMKGPLNETSLIWSVTPLTTVTLKGSTQFVETTIPFSPGAVEERIGLEVSHALLRNLLITGVLNWTRDRYVENPERDVTKSVGVKAEWKLNRNLSIKASFLRSWETSNVPGLRYGENTYLIGMKWAY